MHCVRLAVYGPPAVGKTALIEVLVSHCVQPLRPRTGQDRVYTLTALFDGIIYYVTLLDMHSDLTEAVRPVTADAYILMFDLMSPGQSDATDPLTTLSLIPSDSQPRSSMSACCATRCGCSTAGHPFSWWEIRRTALCLLLSAVSLPLIPNTVIITLITILLTCRSLLRTCRR